MFIRLPLALSCLVLILWGAFCLCSQENNVQILEGPAAITTFMDERKVPALIVLRYLKGCPHCKEIIDFWDGLKIPKGYVLAKTTSAEALKNCGVPQQDVPGVPGVYAFYYQPNEEPHKRKYKQISIGSIEKGELEKRIKQIIS